MGATRLNTCGVARIELQGLEKSFARRGAETVRAVAGLNLSVAPGELLAVVGPSGCGKTTLLRLIAGLDEPDQGTISLNGQSLAGVAAGDRDVAMVFQHHALYPHLSAGENIAFGLEIRRISRPEIQSRVRETAQLLNLNGCLDRLPEELSGGERQRVALGRALVRKPKVLLLDEPLSHLDAQLRNQMRAELARLHAQIGCTMIYVTHDQTEALSLGHRVAVMRAGALEQAAEPLELYRRPANRFVAGFIGSPPMNFFEGTLQLNNGVGVFVSSNGAFHLPVTRALTQTNRPVVLGIRPEDITPGTGNGCIEGTVEGSEFLGPDCLSRVIGKDASFSVRHAPGLLKIGDQVSFLFHMERAHFFDRESGQRLAGAA